MQADHVSGLPELVARTGATAYLPGGRRRRVRAPRAAPTARSSSSATPRSRRSPRPATRSRTTPTSSPTTRAATEPWLVLTGDALLVGDAGRPDLHADGEHTVEEMARTLYRSLTERLLALPDHLVLYPAHYSGLGLRPRAVGQPGLDDRLRAPPQPRAAARLRGRVRAGAAAATSRRRPSGRPRSSPPTAAAGRCAAGRVSAAPVRLGLRENAAQFSLLVADQRVRRRDGRPGALDAAADRPRGLRPRLQRRGAVVHRRLRRSPRR